MDNLKDLENIFKNYPTQNLEHPEDGLSAIRDKLYTILCSPMKDEFTKEAFKWVAELTMITRNFSWICPDGLWNDTQEIKMFLCVARLSLAEIELVIPYLERRIILGEEPEIEDGKVMARSANSEDYDKFGHHLVIVENLIYTLVREIRDDCTDEDDQDGHSKTNLLVDKMSQVDLTNLLKHLKTTMQAMLRYAEIAYQHWDKLNHRDENEQLSSILGSLRLIAIWLADDSCGFVDECKRFLIEFILTILRMDNCDNRDIYVTALHSICSEDDIIPSIKKQPQLRQSLQRYLEHVSHEYQQSPDSAKKQKKQSKMYKLRCGMVRDLLEIVER